MAYEGKNPVKESLIFNNKAAAGVANAPTGKVRIIQRDGTLFSQDETGLEAELGAGSGGGINYAQNGRFETSITDGVTTGGTATTNTAETGSPLYGTQSLNISSGAGVSTNDFAIVDIDGAVIEAGIVNQVTAYLKTDSAVAEGDWTVGIYNVTDAVYATEQTDLKVDIINIHRVPFVPITGKTYVLRVEFTDTTAARILIFDQFTVTPESNSGLAPIVTSWESYTPSQTQGFGTITSRLQWRQVGENVEIKGDLNVGTGTASEAQIELPNSYTVDLIDSTVSVMVGIANDNQTDVKQNLMVLAVDGNTYLNFGHGDITTARNHLSPSTGGNLLINGSRFSFQASVPVAEFKGSSVNLLTQDVVGANDKSKWGIGTAAAYTANTDLDYDSLDTVFPAVGFTNASSVNGLITLPSTGYWDVSASIGCDGAPQWVNTSHLRIVVDAVDRQAISPQVSATSFVLNGTGQFYGVKGQTVSIRCNAAATIQASPTNNWLMLSRSSQYGAFEPIGFALATPTQAGLVRKGTITYNTDPNNYTTTSNGSDPFSGALDFSGLTIGNLYEFDASIVFGSASSATTEVRWFSDGTNGSNLVLRLYFRNDNGGFVYNQTGSKVIFTAASTTLSATWTGATSTIALIEGSRSDSRATLKDLTSLYE